MTTVTSLQCTSCEAIVWRKGNFHHQLLLHVFWSPSLNGSSSFQLCWFTLLIQYIRPSRVRILMGFFLYFFDWLIDWLHLLEFHGWFCRRAQNVWPSHLAFCPPLGIRARDPQLQGEYWYLYIYIVYVEKIRTSLILVTCYLSLSPFSPSWRY